jgi:hypothetical protein
VSNVHRLHLSDRIFFVTVNFRRSFAPLSPLDYEQVAAAIKGIARQARFPIVRADARPLARAHRPGLSTHDFARGSGHQVVFGTLLESPAARRRDCLAAPVLGPLCTAREGIPATPAIHAPEPGAERVGTPAGGLAVVELQQLRHTESGGCGLPHPD